MKIYFVLLALTLAAHAAPSDPGQVAIEFLEKVRDRKLNLEPGGDTALAPQTGEGKRRQIAKQIERLARDLGSDPLEVGAVKQDENYAAVLVRKVGGFDPSRLRVFPVALVMRGKKWEVAPVPASFENAGTGYAIALRKRIGQLEDWMLREQVLDLQKLREQSNTRMRRKIAANLSEAQLRSFDALKAGERFLAACETGDLASVLGLLGGLGAKLPDDWPARIRAAENAFAAGPKAEPPWRLLVAPDVARVVVRHEEDGNTGTVAIACLDPGGTADAPPAIQVVHFELAKSDEGLWRMDPPVAFIHQMKVPPPVEENGDDGEEDEAPIQLKNLGDASSSEWINEFPASWSAAHPAVPQATAEAASEAWLASLRTGSFQSFLATSKLDGDPDNAVKACIKAARTWRDLRSGLLTDFAIPLAFRADGDRAAVIYQFFAARDSDKFTPRSVCFEKSAGGWSWTPEPSTATRDSMLPWIATESERLAAVWQQQLLSECTIVSDLATLEAPTEEETRTCVEAWLEAIHRGDVEEAITRIACLGDPRSGAVALQNLGYEITASRGQPSPAAITAIHRGKIFSAAAVRIGREDGKPVFPLFPVVKTSQGSRILIEIDLFASGNRSRDYLNNAALARLAKSGTDEAAADLKSLFKDHLTKTGELPK